MDVTQGLEQLTTPFAKELQCLGISALRSLGHYHPVRFKHHRSCLYLECQLNTTFDMAAPPATTRQTDAVDKLQCEDCLLSKIDISYCNSCELLLCDRCWDRQLAHRKKSGRQGGAVHDKTDPRIAKQINNVFSQSGDETALRKHHAKDERTAWFGGF